MTILLAQIKAETIHTNQKTESDKHIFRFKTIKSPKSLQQFNQVIIIIEENMILIRDPKTFYFDFGWYKDVNENLKHKIEFIIKRNEYVA